MTRLPSAGLLRLGKPPGPTSRAVVNEVVRRLRLRRVGHAGTLDPFAEGLLLVAWGRATGIVPFLQEYPKTYLAEAEFGRVTDTQDTTGTTLRTASTAGLEAPAVEEMLARFRGQVRQRPPMFSAVRVDGRRLHEIAREGGEIQRPERLRTVFEFALTRWEGPMGEFRIRCEGGTYVRTLIHDLGDALGPGACVTRLVRTATGPHRLEEAIETGRLGLMSDAELIEHVVHPGDALPDWPAVLLEDPVERRAVVCGSWRDPGGRLPAGRARLLDATGALLALAEGGAPPRLLRVFAGEDGA